MIHNSHGNNTDRTERTLQEQAQAAKRKSGSIFGDKSPKPVTQPERT